MRSPCSLAIAPLAGALAAVGLLLPCSAKRPAPPQAGTLERIVETFESPALADLQRTGGVLDLALVATPQ